MKYSRKQSARKQETGPRRQTVAPRRAGKHSSLSQLLTQSRGRRVQDGVSKKNGASPEEGAWTERSEKQANKNHEISKANMKVYLKRCTRKLWFRCRTTNCLNQKKSRGFPDSNRTDVAQAGVFRSEVTLAYGGPRQGLPPP